MKHERYFLLSSSALDVIIIILSLSQEFNCCCELLLSFPSKKELSNVNKYRLLQHVSFTNRHYWFSIQHPFTIYEFSHSIWCFNNLKYLDLTLLKVIQIYWSVVLICLVCIIRSQDLFKLRIELSDIHQWASSEEPMRKHILGSDD